jgi:hypothetical protein
MDAATERIVYNESVKRLASQESVLSGLRARAGTLLGAASLVTAFLAPQALRVERSAAGASAKAAMFDTLAWVATGAFVGVVLCAMAVLLPYKWIFGHSAHELMDHLLDPEPPNGEARLYRHLAYYNDVHHTANATKLGRLFFIFALGCVLLAAEIGLWLFAIVR